ncbi:MAG: hypothetical protein FH761_08485 [Firmicutes bacterium]|nr:hypothetical protein [Bacillota bacterium]
MEERKAKLSVNRSGGTASKKGVTFRVTVPSKWVRDMGLSEYNRHIKLIYDSKEIKIINNEKEMEKLNEILEKSSEKIENEINRLGYIDDTDECDRFLDNISKECEDVYGIDFDEILEMLTNHMKKTYKKKGSCDKTGHYSGCYYKNREGLKAWENSFKY